MARKLAAIKMLLIWNDYMQILDCESDLNPGFDDHNGTWRKTLFGAYGGYEGQYSEHTVEGESTLSAEIQQTDIWIDARNSSLSTRCRDLQSALPLSLSLSLQLSLQHSLFHSVSLSLSHSL
jgi:hypothetical protein